MAAGKPFRATFIWSSIINNLQSQVEVKRRRHNLKSYHDCFLGSEAVDAVLAHVILNRYCGDQEVPRFKAVRLCQALMDSRVFEAVGTRVFGKEKRRATFEDSSFSLYRFLYPVSSEAVLTGTGPLSGSSTEGYSDPSPRTGRSMDGYGPQDGRQNKALIYTNTPTKTDKTLESMLGSLNLNSAITPQMTNLGLSQSLVEQVWRQQSVFRLLQLVELPLLESLLEGKEIPRPALHSMDSDPDLLSTSSYLDREVLKAFSEAQADEWLRAAVDCLEFLPDSLVVEVSRGLASCSEDQPQSKRLLYGLLDKHYGQTQHPPLLSNHVFDIHSGISELLVNGKKEQAVEALQLCLKMQDSRSREELRRLLRFMAVASKPEEVKLHKEVENRMAVKRSFAGAIIYSRRLAKGKLDLMVLFMVEYHCDLFKIPVSLHRLVSDRLLNIVRGKDPDDLITGPTYCRRVTGRDCAENAQRSTQNELRSLLQSIHQNSELSTKEKRRLLGQFYKGHPQIFVQYFGSRLATADL
ncbi:hypothetical protein NHX12_005374 [Muraenolepis orangiensis]|uniref:DEP domain-containing protein 7 n=1 Tax=Muraenolepis orangiensis TaxID=630683 RepID=A0A9Q0IDM7_9TELE|nr:hypothetical protein NHX12_005374 [Muraenolepis orangiensis]